MKTPKSIIQKPYSDLEFEAFFETLQREQLSLAETSAKQDGLNNDPKTERQYFIKIITPLKNTIQKALDFNYARYQPVSNMALVQSLRKTAGNKIHELTKEKNDKSKKANLLEGEKKALKAKLRSSASLKRRLIIPALFGLCEGYLVFNMLQSTKLPFIVSFFWGLLTALVTAFGLHLSANFICKARTTFQRRLRIAIVLVTAFGVALSLGVWRASTYTEVSNINAQVGLSETTNTSGYSPWSFVILSFVSFLVALAFEIKYWISDEEKRNRQMYEDKCAELNTAKRQVADLEREIDSVSRGIAFDSGLALQQQEYALGNERRLVSLAYQAVSVYESVNIDFRRDGACPEFFNRKIDFAFTLYFDKIFNAKSNSNEKSNGTPHGAFVDELMSE